MISDLRLCDICAEIYPRNDPTWGNDKIRVFSFYESGALIIAAAGSRVALDTEQDRLDTLHDWWRDLAAIKQIEVRGFGSVSDSFWQDADSVFDPIFAEIQRAALPIYFTAHSKGGPEVQALASRCVQKGIVPVGLTTFEAPAIGALSGLLAAIPTGRDYAHQGDFIVSAPPDVLHPRSVAWFSDSPLSLFPDPFANHHLTTAVRPALVRYLAAQEAVS